MSTGLTGQRLGMVVENESMVFLDRRDAHSVASQFVRDRVETCSGRKVAQVAGEIVNTALVEGEGNLRLILVTAPDTIRVEVHRGGEVGLARRPGPRFDEYFLKEMGALCESWGYHSAEGSETLWAIVRVTPAPATEAESLRASSREEFEAERSRAVGESLAGG
jgi:hypothetical protein